MCWVCAGSTRVHKFQHEESTQRQEAELRGSQREQETAALKRFYCSGGNRNLPKLAATCLANQRAALKWLK